MPNIFKQSQQVNDHPKRNNFDLSKKINASFKFGTLYPVYCQPVVPGDSFSIDTAFNIKAMPVVFPVQTKMRAHMHYFYVRNKNLWKNFENWISNLPIAGQDTTPHPYISRPDSEFKSGSIHDFLGVPTTVVGDVHFTSSYNFFRDISYSKSDALTGGSVDDIGASLVFGEGYPCATFQVPISYDKVLSWRGSVDLSLPRSFFGVFSPVLDSEEVVMRTIVDTVDGPQLSLLIKNIGAFEDIVDDSGNYTFSLSEDYVTRLQDFIRSLEGDLFDVYFTFLVSVDSSADPMPSPLPKMNVSYYSSRGFSDYSDLNLDLYSRHLFINALPYRAYSSIVNAYYRNTVVDPLKDRDGNVLYNKFIVNDGDGADTYPYQLAQRNYELDFLTSALPSPQQGPAPMVGVTALGDITIEDENGITTARTDVDEAGFVTKVVLTSPAASVDHARTLMNLSASGFNINDFRNCNALQRFLETSIRKGYKYKDFIAGHFGVEPKYVELDLPEFIGGFSRDVSVATVISNADTLGETSGAALGEYGGYAQCVGGSKHSVRHYCDDYGFIMGILCITPTPCYSQLLPKHMIAPTNFLDYYFAEFSNIGMQPITYKEVAPIQSYLESLSDPDISLEDTFGYQRPNYDMVSAVDEVHGDFRGSLRNYVINRIFDTRPELGHDFIAIRPDEVNDIFVDVDPRDDTFIGEIGFSVHAKRPVPRVVIPNLGK